VLRLLLVLASLPQVAHALSVAFYYGRDPLPELAAFDIAVVEARHGFDPARLRRPGFEPFAYVSVGELAADHPARPGMPATCLVGINPAWGGSLIDQSRPDCRAHWLRAVFQPLWQAGWRGFFLDTLDSYRLIPKAEEKAHQAGLIELIREIKARYPSARLFLNRGFELLPEIASLLEGVVAESLFSRYDAATKTYGEVPEEDRRWLLARLKEVQDRYGLPVVVIDYLPPAQREEARHLARRIAAEGFIPWVSDGELASLGVGVREALPRTLIILYDGREAPGLHYLEAHRFLELPAQYLGYRFRYLDMNGLLPTAPHAGRVAGVIVWGVGDSLRPQALRDYLVARRREGIPILFLNTLPFDPVELGEEWGVERMSLKGEIPLQSVLEPFEAPLPPRLITATEALTGERLIPWVRAGKGVLAGLAPWGGFALAPALIEAVPGVDQFRWRLDPFRLLAEGLKLPLFPVPDVTTENGRRLLTLHVDGDSFASRAELPGRPWGGAALLAFLQKHRLPHGISVIEGEIGPDGLNPQHSGELMDIARRIFALPWVEAASHSFSHPFRWSEAAGQGEGGYTLAIPGYRFDPRREILGSRDFVAGLLPPGKSVALFFWTGDCAPLASQLTLVREAGLLNINGGDTVISKSCSSLTCVAPYGLAIGDERQIYAPVANENLYTNLWSGPFWGYRRVIETFERTETPRRLKPVGIYYHFYSATKPAALAALETVYAWAQAQPLHPVFISEYVEKVEDFFDYAIAREGETWLLKGRGFLRTVRLPKGTFPDLGQSAGVAGYRTAAGATYVHLSGAEARLRLTATPPAAPPHLVEANGRLTAFSHQPSHTVFTLRGHVPLEGRLAVPTTCTVEADPKARLGRSGDQVAFRSEHAALTLTVRCPAP
jgi:hypothetical protein